MDAAGYRCLVKRQTPRFRPPVWVGMFSFVVDSLRRVREVENTRFARVVCFSLSYDSGGCTEYYKSEGCTGLYGAHY